MDTPRALLIDSMMRSGVSDADAERAVDRCIKAMLTHGAGAYTTTALATYLLGMNPATAIPYLVAAPVAGASYGFFTSSQCEEIRNAVAFWTTADF
jgi:hypothetical protein